MAGVVAVVVIVVLASALHASSTTSPPNVVGTPVSESVIVGPAVKATSSVAGGPWTMDAVVGMGLASSYSGVGGLISGCSTTWENSSVIEIPSTPSTATPGDVAFWLVALTNASGDLLLVDANDVSGTLVASNAVVVHGSCTSAFTRLGAVPSSVEDSPTIAAAAGPLGGTSFLQDNSGATVWLELLGTWWIVMYTACNLMSPSGSGSTFMAAFYATNGTLVENLGTSQVSCSTL